MATVLSAEAPGCWLGMPHTSPFFFTRNILTIAPLNHIIARPLKIRPPLPHPDSQTFPFLF